MSIMSIHEASLLQITAYATDYIPFLLTHVVARLKNRPADYSLQSPSSPSCLLVILWFCISYLYSALLVSSIGARVIPGCGLGLMSLQVPLLQVTTLLEMDGFRWNWYHVYAFSGSCHVLLFTWTQVLYESWMCILHGTWTSSVSSLACAATRDSFYQC